MPSVPADFRIEARWLAPMSLHGGLLENHALVVSGGRIVEVLPGPAAAARYAASTLIRRSSHLLIPGLINGAAHTGAALLRAAESPDSALARRFAGADFARDSALGAIAEMLRSGVTCFADRGAFPAETARTAADQGLRAMIGLPVSPAPGAWGASIDDCVTHALRLRDEYRGHPLISTAFAPLAANDLPDEAFVRIATLADELDAGIILDLAESGAAVTGSLHRHGMRPLERMWQLGLLTPALNAVHMTHADAGDIELAARTGISVSLCALQDLETEGVLPPAAALAAAGIPLGIATGAAATYGGQGLWPELRTVAAMLCRDFGARRAAWLALSWATRGAAAALGLEADVGSLEAGKWADLCCIDLSGPATQPLGDPVAQLVYGGGRDLVSDVWVAGRQLLAEGNMTRLDWSGAAARAHAWGQRMYGGA